MQSDGNTNTKAHILAIDLGTSGCKVGVISLDGKVSGWAFRPVALHVVDEVGAEQVPDDWWTAFLGAADDALAQSEVKRNNILAICSSTQGEGTLPVDRDGNPLMNAITWLDMRGQQHLHDSMKGSLKIAGYNPLKLVRWLRLCGGAPALSGKDPAAHMLLVRDRFPGIYERTYKFLNVLDFFNLRLTGRFVATQDSILTSWVTDNRDPANIRYDGKLIAQSGIEADKFPDLVRCDEVLGPVLPDVAKQLGIPSSTPVVAGAIDNTAAAIGSGAVGDYDTHLYVGSSSWLAAHVPFKKANVLHQIASVPCALPSRYLMMAMQSSGASSIEFFKNRMLDHSDGLTEGGAPRDIFARLDTAASGIAPGSEGLMYLPWLFGERSPNDESALRAGFLNIHADHSRATMARAVLEGTALNTRMMADSVKRFLGRWPEQINIVGGGAQSDSWCQIYADVLNTPIRRPIAPIKANALGAAVIGAVGVGQMDYASAAEMVHIEKVFEPDLANKGIYDARFDVFRDLQKRLTPTFRHLNSKTSGGAHG